MSDFVKPLQDLIDKFRSLDGVGKKSAMRMAFSILDMQDADAYAFAQAILDAKTKIGLCSVCQNLSSEEICPICSSSSRDNSVVCVVEVIFFSQSLIKDLSIDILMRSLQLVSRCFHPKG